MHGQGISAAGWCATHTECYLSIQIFTKSSSMPPGPGSITLISHQGDVSHYLLNVLFKQWLFSISMLFLGTQEHVFFTITVVWGDLYESVYHSVCLEPMKGPILPHGCSWVLTRKQGTVTKSNTFTWYFVLWTSSKVSWSGTQWYLLIYEFPHPLFFSYI